MGSLRVRVCICACVRSGASALVNLYLLASTGMRSLCKMVFMGLVLFNLTAMVRYVAELAALILVQRLHVHLCNFALVWARNCMRIYLGWASQKLNHSSHADRKNL